MPELRRPAQSANSARTGCAVPRGSSSAEHGDTDSVLDSVIRSKVQPSPVRAQTLTRTRLLDWLTDHVPDRLKLITAEAGYGKTTLLADFSRRRIVRCLWYKLETSDRDWVTFVNYLIAAGHEVEPDFAPRTSDLLRHMATINLSREVIVNSLVSELARLGEEPTLLILDDLHLVDQSEDVRAILGRLLQHAPPSFTILLSSRRPPNLPMGRLQAQGEVARLSTHDLRFSPAETKELFATTYGHPLEIDLLREVDARTEGWGASLQLLYSSIRSRRPDEVRDFIHSLSGAEGSLYDFLAEEVLAHLSHDLQRFVTEASILQRIVPAFAAASLSRTQEPVPIPSILAWTDDAEEMGLLGRSSVTSISRRFHPLLRDFLQRRLEASTSWDERRQMHLRVARAAESVDWLTACHHLIEAREHAEAMRLLSDSAGDALSTGLLGSASELLPRIEGIPLPPAVLAMQARALAVTDPARALSILAIIDLDTVTTAVRALIRQIRTYALFRSGDREGLISGLDDLVDDATTPESLRRIAVAQLMMLNTSSGRVPMRHAAQSLASLARQQVTAGQHYFAAISYHNALVSALAQGDNRRAVEFGRLALREFGATHEYRFEAQSTHAGLYVAMMELGEITGARIELEAVLAADRDADADAFADIAFVRALVGDSDGAMRLLGDAQRRLVDGWTDLAATASVTWAEALVLLVSNQAAAASTTLGALPESSAYSPGHASVQALRTAVAAVLANHPDSESQAARALELATTQGAWGIAARAAILNASMGENSKNLRIAICEGVNRGALVLLEMADVLGRSLYLLDPPPTELTDSIVAWPARWLPILRRGLEDSHRANAMASARLLAKFGTRVDAPRLAAYDKTNRKYLKGVRHARILAERESDRLYVRDLGRVEYQVGDRVIAMSDTRRKAAGVLAYLVTRPNHTATREQVLDAIWPDSDPHAGSNSLHQTLYFLRRDIDPWYDDESSASYVSYEGEMLWLSPSLVCPDSATFDTRASSALLPVASLEDQLSTLAMYRGKFAPDFEYEEWSLAWRDRLHATYLGLVKASFKRLVASERHEEAIHVCQVALALDSEALDVEQALVWAYSSIGSESAASRQYAHFARAHNAELGLDPPSLTALRALPVREL